MNHSLILLGIDNLSLVDSSKCQDVKTGFRHSDEIFLLTKNEASNLTLPKLETLMSEKGSLSLVLRDIHDSHVVSVDVNCFVTDNQLFVLLLLVSMSQHEDVCVSKIELVFPLGEESMLRWILLVHSDNEETKLLFELVCEDVKHSVFMIVDNLFHAPDLVQLIQINFLLLLEVKVNTILRRGSNHNSLGIIHLEKLWLSQERVRELMDSVDLLCVEVQSDDSIGLHENEGIQLLTARHVLEVVLHAHFIEHWDVFHHYSFVELVVLVSSLLKYEKLINFLLLHDKVLSRNDGKEFFAHRLSHTDNLIWLSSLSLE